jgi:hypothetical protein
MRFLTLKHLMDVIQAVARPANIRILDSSSLLPNPPEPGEREAGAAGRNLSQLFRESGA